MTAKRLLKHETWANVPVVQQTLVTTLQMLQAISRRSALTVHTSNYICSVANSNSTAEAMPPKQLCPKKTSLSPRQWVKSDLKQPDISWSTTAMVGIYRIASSQFQLFFDDALIEHIIEMSNLYAMQNSKQLAGTLSEIGLVISNLLVSGYFPLVNR